MKTEHIREYVSLAGTKNYSKTAEQFFLSQPTLSKHIAAIESEIGCNLINHNSHGFELTEFGLFALDEFVSLLESYQNIMKRAEQMKDGVRGTLVTGMLYYQANKWIRPVIQRFQTNYPEVHVKTVSGQPDQLFYGVSDGSMDAAFLFYNSSFMKLDRKKYQFLTVFQEPVIALFSPDSSLNNPARKITMEQLSGHRFLRNENGTFMNDFNNCFESYLKKNQIHLLEERVLLDNIDFLTSSILETDSFSIHGMHVKDFQPDLAYAEIEDITAMQTGILARKNTGNPLLDHLLEIIPEIRKRDALTCLKAPSKME